MFFALRITIVLVVLFFLLFPPKLRSPADMTFDVEDDVSAMADALDIIGEHKDGWQNF